MLPVPAHIHSCFHFLLACFEKTTWIPFHTTKLNFHVFSFMLPFLLAGTSNWHLMQCQDIHNKKGWVIDDSLLINFFASDVPYTYRIVVSISKTLTLSSNTIIVLHIKLNKSEWIKAVEEKRTNNNGIMKQQPIVKHPVHGRVLLFWALCTWTAPTTVVIVSHTKAIALCVLPLTAGVALDHPWFPWGFAQIATISTPLKC